MLRTIHQYRLGGSIIDPRSLIYLHTGPQCILVFTLMLPERVSSLQRGCCDREHFQAIVHFASQLPTFTTSHPKLVARHDFFKPRAKDITSRSLSDWRLRQVWHEVKQLQGPKPPAALPYHHSLRKGLRETCITTNMQGRGVSGGRCWQDKDYCFRLHHRPQGRSQATCSTPVPLLSQE